MTSGNLLRVTTAVVGFLIAGVCASNGQSSRRQPLEPEKHSAVGVSPVSELSEKAMFARWRRAQDMKRRPATGIHRQTGQHLGAETVLLNEGFEGESFPPSGWTQVVVSGSPAWDRTGTSPHSGTWSAYSNFGPSSPTSVKYLITPRVSLNGLLLYRLSFWIQRGFSGIFSPDTVYIRLSTTDSLPAHFSTTLFSCYTGPDTSTNPNIYTTTYKKFSFEFTGVSGTAWLAFDHEDADGQSIFLDDVQFEEIVNNDILASSVDEPSSAARSNLGVSLQPKATFKNSGILAQSSIPVRLKLINPLGVVVYDTPRTISFLAPNDSVQVIFGSFTPSTPGNYVARALAEHPGDMNPSNDSVEVQFIVPDDVSGVRTVGSGGNFTTLFDAVRYLNENNVAGTLTFLLTSSSYVEQPLAIDRIYYTTAPQPVVFKPSGGVSPTITISPSPASPYALRIRGAGNLTIDGSNSGAATRDMTIVVDTTAYSGQGILLTDGCKNVTVKNLVVKGYRKDDGSESSAIVVDTLSSGKRDTNLVFRNLRLLRAYNGFYLRGPGARSAKITISECDFGGAGLDAISQAGVVAFNVDSLAVVSNDIRNLYRDQGIVDLYGIFLGSGCTNAIVRSNNIHAIRNAINSFFACGLLNSAGSGSNLLCYNNFLYDIISQGGGTGSNLTLGVYSGNAANTGDRYYYNSIFLYGQDSSTSPDSYSTGVAVEQGVSALQLVNNIVVNSMTMSGSSTGNKSYCVRVAGNVWPAGSSSNRNDLYSPGPQGVIGFFNNANRISLGDWQAASGQDANSVTADPVFVSAVDLHVQLVGGGSPVDGKGTPVAGITTDIDNELRHASMPDIGADEFNTRNGVTISLSQGWNIVSLPVVPADARTSTLFPGALSKAWAYQGVYVQKDTLTHGVGYWLKFASPLSVEIMGSPVTTDSVQVVAGWNLIGSVLQPIKTSAVARDPTSLVTSQYFRYLGSYAITDTIHPGLGYWVKTNQSGKLILSAGGMVSPAPGEAGIPEATELPPPPPGESAETMVEIPERYALGQNFPNPFNPSTVIPYQLPIDARVSLKIYDVLGQEVAVLVDGEQNAGYKRVKWDAAGLPSGIYYCRMHAMPNVDGEKNFAQVIKLMLVR